MDLDVHVVDVQSHSVEGVGLELRDRLLQRLRPLFFWDRHGCFLGAKNTIHPTDGFSPVGQAADLQMTSQTAKVHAGTT